MKLKKKNKIIFYKKIYLFPFGNKRLVCTF